MARQGLWSGCVTSSLQAQAISDPGAVSCVGAAPRAGPAVGNPRCVSPVPRWVCQPADTAEL